MSFFIYTNPAGMEAIAEFLASQGEAGGAETTALECKGKRFPCFQVNGGQVDQLKQMIADKPDVFTSARLFTRRDGTGKSAHEVTFMLGKSNRIRKEVMKAVALRGKRGETPSRKLLKTAV